MGRASILVAASIAASGCSFDHGALGSAEDAAVDAMPDTGPAHCFEGSCRRKPVTIHGADVMGTHSDFVLLVHTPADPELAANARGVELRFTTADNTPLSFERQLFNQSTGELVAWVKLPTLAPVDTTLWLYYGDANATDHDSAVDTWSAGYAGVWHLDELSAATANPDVSGHGNTATPTNGPTLGVSGMLLNAISFDGSNDYLRVAQSTSLAATTGSATFALWINWTSVTSSHYQRVLASENRFFAAGDGYEWAAQPGSDFFLYPWGGAEDYNLGPTLFTAATWQYLVATLDFSTKAVTIYVDGRAMTYTTENAPTKWTSLGTPSNWLWGCDLGLQGCFDGELDEIQVMSTPRSADWVATSYANQKLGSTMVTVGAEQMLEP